MEKGHSQMGIGTHALSTPQKTYNSHSSKFHSPTFMVLNFPYI